ncbi:MAG: replication-associated recombination protein A [Tenericutes bacterium]|nr:replication-associated recombination protein A [Mycoplasmatota bacterium]
MNEPLAYKLRPTSINNVIGQKHLVSKDKVIYNMVKNKKIFSMILYGKPGIGKTSIANAIITELNQKTRFLNAVINNKKDFDIVVEEAKMYKGIILVMDEIHRMNKDKQDLLLPYIESGLVTIIGLTASNPYHTINPAIRSRCQLFELKELTDDDIKEGIKKACKSEYLEGISIDKTSIDYIVKLSGGDLRYAYNILELAYYGTKDKVINIDILKSINNKPVFLHDKNQDGYYDVLSAFQKSIRGSDVDASLHYLARLIEGGDFDSIYRRMSALVYEDIGLANPSMGPKVMACINACERLGMPELILPLGLTVIELALSPKSNSAYLAINSALKDIEEGNIGEIPKHINSSAFGYKYPHDYPDAFVEQDYLPDKLKDNKYYIPKTNSKYEQALKQMYDKYKKNSN